MSLTRKTVLFSLFVLAAGFLHLHATPLLMDEVLHERQIQNFAAGNFTLLPRLEMLPTFHFLLAGFVSVTGLSSPAALRFVCALISAIFLGGCFLLAREREQESATVKTVQVLFLPILFPFLFLVYTDVLALAFLVFAVFAAKKDRPIVAALLGAGAAAVRQIHFFWLGVIAAASPGRRAVPYCSAAALLFAALAVLYGGAAVNAPGAGLPLRPYLGNILFFLFLLPILFLPRFVFECARIRAALADWRVWTLAVSVFVISYYGFSVPHPFNSFSGHLRTSIILAVENDPPSRFSFSLLASFGVLTLASFSFSRADGIALGAVTVLSLLPLKLIEQRYFLPPLVFGTLLHCGDRAVTGRAQTIYSAALAFVFFEGIVRTLWFP